MQDIKRRGLMYVISAPSGTGKTTLANLLLEADKHIHISISVTTREKRPNEVDGRDYYFVDEETFRKMIEAGQMLEYAEIFGHLYGIPRLEVEKYLKNGEDLLFAIDWQGHRKLIATARDDVTSVFILPPSKQELLERLKSRNQDDQVNIINRMENSNLEISHWHEYDYVIINRTKRSTLKKLLSILRAERLKKTRRIGLPNFIGNLITQDTTNL